MHNQPLWSTVTLDCECCGIPRQFSFKSASDHVICPSCERHVGDTDAKRRLRDRDHADLFRSELLVFQLDLEDERRQHAAALQREKDTIASRDAVIREQKVAIADLRAAIKSGELNPAVEAWMADEAVRDAFERRDSAYRSRDHAFACLWSLARLHRPDDHREGFCVCRKKADHCDELVAIGPELLGLERWEAVQIERLHDDREHGLPYEHPEVRRLGGSHLRRRRSS